MSRDRGGCFPTSHDAEELYEIMHRDKSSSSDGLIADQGGDQPAAGGGDQPAAATQPAWVKEATDEFGEPTTEQARADVDSAFCKWVGTEYSSKILEEIPGVGLVVAAVYSAHGATSADSTLAINMRAILGLLGNGVAFWLGAEKPITELGRPQLGLLLQMAIFSYHHDKQCEVLAADDISAAHFIVDLATAAAALGGATGLKIALADENAANVIKVLLASSTLASHLPLVPPFFTLDQVAS